MDGAIAVRCIIRSKRDGLAPSPCVFRAYFTTQGMAAPKDPGLVIALNTIALGPRARHVGSDFGEPCGPRTVLVDSGTRFQFHPIDTRHEGRHSADEGR